MGKKEETLILKRVGLKIKKIRLEQKLSRTQLAFEIKTSEKHLNRIEDGAINTGILKIFQLAEALGVKPEDLIRLEKEKK